MAWLAEIDYFFSHSLPLALDHECLEFALDKYELSRVVNDGSGSGTVIKRRPAIASNTYASRHPK